MIDCVHYFGHLLPFGVSDPGFVSPCSHSDTLEAISWLFQLMSGGLFPDDAAEWCKIPLQGFLNCPVVTVLGGGLHDSLSVAADENSCPSQLSRFVPHTCCFSSGAHCSALKPWKERTSPPATGDLLFSLSSAWVESSVTLLFPRVCVCTNGRLYVFVFHQRIFSNIPGSWSHGISIDGFFMSQLRQL